ncbi:hypothetical protein ACFV7Q_11695 [Streptomyces sp. NPDC059851]|uniref:hypothetical protein n=1 Tax=Streptomyces sp. NPDC059851 TaxID=3346971 RepID=UPI00365B4ECA
MGGMQNKRQKPGKGREEQERMDRSGQDPTQSGTGQEGGRGKSPEELRRRQEEMTRRREEDEMRDDER